MKIAIIGAGASGMMAALQIDKKNKVFLIDGNEYMGKKILSTGNGKCNYWNESIGIDKYNTDSTKDLERIIEKKEEVYKYLEDELKIYPKIKDGYYYPYSKTAASIREIFERKVLEKENIEFINNFKVINIKEIDGKYRLIGSHKTLEVDKIIIATGSYAAPKTGSDGSIFEILSKMGININKMTPALVPLIGKDLILKEWNGVRTDVKLSLIDNNEVVKEENGEIQLTDYGISGIVTFNISSLASKMINEEKECYVLIDFIPEINNLKDFIDKRSNNSTLESIFESIFNYKLSFALIKSSYLERDDIWEELDDSEKNKLIENIKSYKLKIIDTEGFDRAQVARGGIPLKELDENFKSKFNNDLYIIGEATDVDGICGGFNLSYAFISGYIAGKGISND